ncbi:GGDEF domain-containing protein [Selenihalanaerobacter shriftii]|uniref:Diguanylate cyclase (GGDEF) domain-containing protein n=1 Tax=Selenihalanaerobacter shriftii TaxID=142842 RepID=A0A1T4LQ56_9FIRM|nr:GGDEF domain-containing protein [Selenihalanaerobacter shriftii]SJZ56594.1 diguanylate cyclase (GGDEF) domain-containing protein [Selenihalanaerobacter shriftii]
MWKNKKHVKFFIFISNLMLGVIYGLACNYLIMPHNQLVYFILTGAFFGLINYFAFYKILEKYISLKRYNIELNQKLKTDKLTGLFNRRTFEKDTKILNNKCYSIIFIDIDNFREFNNKFGHKIGDSTLKKVSQAIQNSVRDGDKVYRYGGEEIVVLLKDCNKKRALTISERIRLQISQLDNSPYSEITASLGVATYPEDGNHIQDIIEASDIALLSAKDRGKNCTILYMG